MKAGDQGGVKGVIVGTVEKEVGVMEEEGIAVEEVGIAEMVNSY